jgi:hypothetical protein
VLRELPWTKLRKYDWNTPYLLRRREFKCTSDSFLLFKVTLRTHKQQLLAFFILERSDMSSLEVNFSRGPRGELEVCF